MFYTGAADAFEEKETSKSKNDMSGDRKPATEADVKSIKAKKTSNAKSDEKSNKRDDDDNDEGEDKKKIKEKQQVGEGKKVNSILTSHARKDINHIVGC